jgi:hypothetical protein
MDADELSKLCNCAVCHAGVSPQIDHVFELAPDALLCWDCAIRRGGRYDLIADRWVAAPDTSGIAGHEASHP